MHLVCLSALEEVLDVVHVEQKGPQVVLVFEDLDAAPLVELDQLARERGRRDDVRRRLQRELVVLYRLLRIIGGSDARGGDRSPATERFVWLVNA